MSKPVLHTFWTEDVKRAFNRLMVRYGSPPSEVEVFLSLIEDEYKQRWERDPKGGEGAVGWLTNLLNNNGDL